MNRCSQQFGWAPRRAVYDGESSTVIGFKRYACLTLANSFLIDSGDADFSVRPANTMRVLRVPKLQQDARVYGGDNQNVRIPFRYDGARVARKVARSATSVTSLKFRWCCQCVLVILLGSIVKRQRACFNKYYLFTSYLWVRAIFSSPMLRTSSLQ